MMEDERRRSVTLPAPLAAMQEQHPLLLIFLRHFG